ncbi:hypothetical protein M0R45_007323 [Rubus argutus]|uniref:Uncharacterized protein n=1 Tax=Rubus argutus TaxID=59490 RepID=A0AAW1XZD1_RUBAR
MKQGEEKEFLFVEKLPDGQVYCLCPLPGVKESEIFQVLDTTRKGSKKKWLPLQAPPADKYPKMGVILIRTERTTLMSPNRKMDGHPRHHLL